MILKYRISFKFLSKYYALLLTGIKNTLIICSLSLVFSFILGILLALMRRSNSKIMRGFSACWVNILRNTPFLVQLFFFYYGLPELGISTSPMIVSVIALSINGSASNCEIIRSGLLAVKKGYYETAYALGFTKFQVMKDIIIPVSLRIAFKALTNNFINLILTSSTCFAATTMEIMGAAKCISSYASKPFEIFLLILILYCILTFTISFACKAIEKKIHIQL